MWWQKMAVINWSPTIWDSKLFFSLQISVAHCFPLLQWFTFWSIIRCLMFWCVEACSPRRFTTWRWFFSSAFLLGCWYCQLSPIPCVLYRFGVQIMDYWISIILYYATKVLPCQLTRETSDRTFCIWTSGDVSLSLFNVLQLMLFHLRK